MRVSVRCRGATPAFLLLACVLGACGDRSGPQRTFAVRGVIEGFYGRPYSQADRLRLIRFIGARGMNTYVYAPKNDPKQRNDWRVPYEPDELAQFGELAAAGERVGVRFVFAISPGLSYDPDDPNDFALLAAKLDALHAAGAGGVALLFDDLLGPAPPAVDPMVQATLLERTAALVSSFTPDVPFWFISNIYAGPIADLEAARGFYGGLYPFPPRDYFAAYSSVLPLDVPTMWTGLGVFASTIHSSDAAAFRSFAGGRQVIVWDNFPVNDSLATSLFLGPYRGRDADLPGTIDGILLNLMTQPAAGLVAVATGAAYMRDTVAYDPGRAFDDAVDDVGGAGAAALHLFALQQDGHPALAGETPAVELGRRIAAWNAAAGSSADASSAQAELRSYLAALAANRDDLQHTIDDPQLLEDIDPWSQKLSALAGAALTGLDATLGRASAADYQRQRDAANASPYLVAANGVTPSIATLIGGTPNPPVDRFADLFAAIDRRL